VRVTSLSSNLTGRAAFLPKFLSCGVSRESMERQHGTLKVLAYLPAGGSALLIAHPFEQSVTIV
jgi:hypothetical protein